MASVRKETSARKIPSAMTIAGSDSGAGAGVQADLKTFAALGVYGTSVLTAITAQNTLAVTTVHEVPTNVISSQIDAVVTDIGADAVKTGMLSSSASYVALTDQHTEHGAGKNDPVREQREAVQRDHRMRYQIT